MCTVLHCAVLCCTVLYCTVLYCTVLLPPGVKPIAVNKHIISTVGASGTRSLEYSGQLIPVYGGKLQKNQNYTETFLQLHYYISTVGLYFLNNTKLNTKEIPFFPVLNKQIPTSTAVSPYLIFSSDTSSIN